MIFQISPKLSVARDLPQTYRETVPQTRPCNSKASIAKSVVGSWNLQQYGVWAPANVHDMHFGMLSSCNAVMYCSTCIGCDVGIVPPSSGDFPIISHRFHANPKMVVQPLPKPSVISPVLLCC